MEDNDYVDSLYLSGGLFLSLVLSSAYSKDEEGHDIKINRKEFMDCFKTIFNPNIKKNNHSNYSSDISKYLSCKFNGSGQIGFFVYCEGDRFDKELHDSEKYSEIYARTEAFIKQWIDPEQEKELIRRILFVLSQDVEAEKDLKYRYPDGSVVTKSSLLSNKHICLCDFLIVIIWLCMIKRSKNNTCGRETYLKLFSKTQDRWEYCRDIRDAFNDIYLTQDSLGLCEIGEFEKTDKNVINNEIIHSFADETKTTKCLIKAEIGEVAVWIKTEDSYGIRFYNRKREKISSKKIAIISAIVEYSIKNDSYIPASEVASIVSLMRGKIYYDNDISKEIYHIRHDAKWGEIICSTRKGYRINDIVIYREESNISITGPLVGYTMCPYRKTVVNDDKNALAASRKTSVSELIQKVSKEGLSWLQVPVGLDYSSSGTEPTVFSFDFCKNGNYIIYGMSGKGKTVLVKTLISSICNYYLPSEVSVYVLDGGTRGQVEYSLSTFKDNPNVKGLALGFEEDKLVSLEQTILEEITARKELLMSHCVHELDLYQKKTGDRIPAVVVIIDDFLTLTRLHPDSIDFIEKIARLGTSVGIYLVYTTQRVIDVPDKILLGTNSMVVFGNLFLGSEYVQAAACIFDKIPHNLYSEAIEWGEPGFAWVVNKNSSENPILVQIASNEEVYSSQVTLVSKNNNEKTNMNDALVQSDFNSETEFNYISIEDLRINQKLSWFQIPIGMYNNRIGDESGVQLLDLSKSHCAVYGATGYGKTTFLKTLVTSACLFYTPEDVSFYILSGEDFALGVLEHMPHVGGVFYNFEEAKIVQFGQYIDAEIDRRRELLAKNSACNFTEYRNRIDAKEPLIVIVVDDIEAVLSLYEDIGPVISRVILQGAGLGICVVYSAQSYPRLSHAVIDCINTEVHFSFSKSLNENQSGLAIIKSTTDSKKNNTADNIINVAMYARGDDSEQRNNNLKIVADRLDREWTKRRPFKISNKVSVFTPQTRCYFMSPLGAKLYINSGTHIIGKEAKTADIFICDRSISRLHAIITVLNGENWLQDMNSLNGTFINGKRIKPGIREIVYDKDMLRFGDKEYIFRVVVGYLNVGEKIVTLECGTYLVGFDIDKKDILINTDSVGVLHSFFTVSNKQIWVQDVNSNDGTYINGKRIPSDCSTEIHDGDSIRFGDVVCILHFFGESNS